MEDIIIYDVSAIYATKDDYVDSVFYEKTRNKLVAIFDTYDCFKIENPPPFFHKGNVSIDTTTNRTPPYVELSHIQFTSRLDQTSSSMSTNKTLNGSIGSFSNQGRRHHIMRTSYHSGVGGVGRYKNMDKPNKARMRLKLGQDDKVHTMTMGCLNKLTKENYYVMAMKMFLQVEMTNIIGIIDTIFNICFTPSNYTYLYISLVFFIFDKTKNSGVKTVILHKIKSTIEALMRVDTYDIDDIPNESYDVFCNRVKKKGETISKVKSMMYIFQHNVIASMLDIEMNDFCRALISLADTSNLTHHTLVTIVECLVECFEDHSGVEFYSLTKYSWKKLIDLKKLDLDRLYAFLQYQISKGNSSKLKFKCVDLEDKLQTYSKEIWRISTTKSHIT
jgi:hypothetical protein